MSTLHVELFVLERPCPIAIGKREDFHRYFVTCLNGSSVCLPANDPLDRSSSDATPPLIIHFFQNAMSKKANF